jgi:hypothetical protein
LETFNATPSGISVSTFFNPGARLIRMNQKTLTRAKKWWILAYCFKVFA